MEAPVSYGFTYPYYRDPREDERGIAALASRGRAPDGPSSDQVSSSFSALARLGLVPDETPPEAPPDAPQESPDAGAFAALRRQLEAQAPPEPESSAEPAVDPEAEQAILRSAHGALSFKNAEQQAAAQAAAPKPVDPEIQRVGLASSYGALAQNAPPPPVTRKPSPVPVGLQDRVQPQEFNLAPPEPQSQAEYDSEHPAAKVGGLPQQDDDGTPPGVNPWAIAASLMNDPSGKGVQQIVGLAQQQRQAWEHAKTQKLENAYKQQQYELGKGNLEARQAENKIQSSRDARERDKWENPDKYLSAEQKAKAKRDEEEHNYKIWKEGDVSAQGWEEKRLSDERAKKSDALGEARETRAEHTEARAVAAAQRQADAAKLAQEREDRIEKGQTEAATTAKRDKFSSEARQYTKDNEYFLAQAGELKTIDELVKKYDKHLDKDGNEVAARDLPGQGFLKGRVPNAVRGLEAAAGLDPEENEDAIAINLAKSRLADFALRKVSGAAAPLAEADKIAMNNGSKPGATLAEFKAGMEAAHRYVGANLRAYSTGREDVAAGVLKNFGLEAGVDSTATPAAKPAPAKTEPTALKSELPPAISADEPEHDTEEYWKGVAKQPSTVTLTSPDGKETKSFQLDPSGFNKEFDQKVRSGWKNLESNLGDTGEKRRDVLKPGDAPAGYDKGKYEAFKARLNGSPADEDPDSEDSIRKRWEERRRARGGR